MVLVLPAPPVVRVKTAARLSVFFLMPGTNAFPAVPFRTIGLALSALSAIFSTRCCTPTGGGGDGVDTVSRVWRCGGPRATDAVTIEGA